MMVANVMYYRNADWYYDPRARGTVRGQGDSDTYVFDLTPMSTFGLHGPQGDMFNRWVFKGKIHYDVFIPVDVTGYEHIPQEFYAALDQAFVTDSPVEFPDPLLDSLAVQGA